MTPNIAWAGSSLPRVTYFRASCVLVLALIWLLPIVLLVLGSFESPERVRRHPGEIWPDDFSGANYQALFSSDYPMWLWNSAIVAIVGTLVALGAGIPLGFAAGYHNDRVATLLIRILLLVYLLPPIFLVFPILSLAVTLGGRGSAAVVGYLSGSLALPVCAWILKSQFALVPKQLFETAELDGLAMPRRLLHVIAPSAARGVVAAGMFALIIAWGEYVFSIALLPRADDYTISTGIPHFLQGDIWAWDLLLPAIVIAALPPVAGGILATTFLARLLRLSPPDDHA